MTETTTDSGLRHTDIKTGTGETATGRGQSVIPPEPGHGTRGADGIVPPDVTPIF
jgi:hypothetical protein